MALLMLWVAEALMKTIPSFLFALFVLSIALSVHVWVCEPITKLPHPCLPGSPVYKLMQSNVGSWVKVERWLTDVSDTID